MTLNAPYTPTTDQIREGYAHDPESDYRDPLTDHAAVHRRSFNQWLTKHDAEVAATAKAEQREADAVIAQKKFSPFAPVFAHRAADIISAAIREQEI